MKIPEPVMPWKKRLLRIGLHLLFWMIIIVYFGWGFGYNINYKTSLQNSLLFVPGHVLLVYSLLYFLIPRFLITKRYLAFFLGFLGVLSLCTCYAWITELKLRASDSFQGVSLMTGRAILPFIHVAGIAISIKLLDYWYRQKQQTADAQREKLVTELELLKSQIHPHFLFNTLNNLYAFTLEKSEKAPEIVLKLSSLLRFMIYESSSALIPLVKEVTLMREYIDLEQLRYGDRLDVSITISGKTGGYLISPLLLLPLVENAFKHGTSRQLDQCWISFDLRIVGATMHFKVVNSMDMGEKEMPDAGLAKEAPGGIGLRNVRRRLELLYPDKHQFDVLMQEDVFVVNLALEMDEQGDKLSGKKLFEPVNAAV